MLINSDVTIPEFKNFQPTNLLKNEVEFHGSSTDGFLILESGKFDPRVSRDSQGFSRELPVSEDAYKVQTEPLPRHPRPEPPCRTSDQ